jgi:hypothetical protein
LQFTSEKTDAVKFSFDRPSASIMSTGKQVIPRNKIVFHSGEGVSPDKKVSPFVKPGKKQPNDNFSIDEFNSVANIDKNSTRKDQTASLLEQASHKQEFVIRKNKHKY